MGSDYVIVGGGVFGAGTAWELARRGADVTLLEADRIASGASGGLGKRGVRANRRDRREIPLMKRAFDRWETLDDELGVDTGFERIGHLHLYEEGSGGLSGGIESAPAVAWTQNRQGIRTEVLDAAGVHEIEPHVTESVVGGLYSPDDAVANQAATTRGYATAAEDDGATIHEETPVEEVITDGDEIDAVVTADGDRFGVDGTLVLLSNAHVPGVVEEAFGLPLPVWSVLPQAMQTEPLDEVPVSHMVTNDARPVGLKAVTGDRVMIAGAIRGRWNDDRTGGEPIPENVERGLAEAVAICPVLDGVEVETVEADSPESMSADNLPIVDALPGVANTVIGTGWSAHSFAIAPAVNGLLADWLLDGAKPPALDPYRYDRFL